MIAGSGKRGMARGTTNRAPTTATKTIVTPSIARILLLPGPSPHPFAFHTPSPARPPAGAGHNAAHATTRAACTIGFLGVVLGVGVLAPTAAQAAPFELSLSGAAAYAGKTTPIRILLTDAGQPVAGAMIVLKRRVGGVWEQPIPIELTDANGLATVPIELRKRASDNVFSASYATGTPDEARSGAVLVELKQQNRQRDPAVSASARRGPRRTAPRRPRLYAARRGCPRPASSASNRDTFRPFVRQFDRDGLFPGTPPTRRLRTSSRPGRLTVVGGARPQWRRLPPRTRVPRR